MDKKKKNYGNGVITNPKKFSVFNKHRYRMFSKHNFFPVYKQSFKVQIAFRGSETYIQMQSHLLIN